jgi:carboxylesterase type B
VWVGVRSHRVGMVGVVKTDHGQMRGRVADGGSAFLGVPYAAAPFGVNRLLPPQPAQRWDGVRAASSLGPEPPQVAPPGSVSGWVTATGEDCLVLNVWTPDPRGGWVAGDGVDPGRDV